MKLMIEISEEDYNWIKQAPKGIIRYLCTLNVYEAIKNGSPYPKGELATTEDIAKAFQLGLAFGFGEKHDEMDKIVDMIRNLTKSERSDKH